MAMCLIRSSILNTIRCNLRGNFRNLSSRQFFCLNSQPRISKITVQQRSINWWSRFIGRKSEKNYKILDQLSNEVVLIYRNDGVDKYLKWIYLSLCVMSSILIAVVVFKFDVDNQRISLLDKEVLMPDGELPKRSNSVERDILIFIIAYCLCFTVFYGSMKRIPVRIYKVPQTQGYIFICNAGIPFTTRRLTCKKGQCVRVDHSQLPSFLPSENIYSVANKLNVFLFDDSFRVPADLHVLLGLQEDYED